jgi:hypothetical protein
VGAAEAKAANATAAKEKILAREGIVCKESGVWIRRVGYEKEATNEES